MNIRQYFLERARISRKSLARFANETAANIDRVADGFGHGDLVTLEEAQEILTEMDAGDEDEDDEDGDHDGDEDDESDEVA